MSYVVFHLICAVLMIIFLKLRFGEVSVGMVLVSLMGGAVIFILLLAMLLIDELDDIKLF